jgi:hypothetical protein
MLFAHSIAEESAPIVFPMTLGATATLQLTACSTFSDYFRFGKLEMPGEAMTKILLLILQKTSDSRSGYFLETLVQLCPIQYWIQTMRRILLSDSLLDDHVSAIEPNRAVKIAILHSSFATLTAIAEQPVLNTEYLDDFIAAVCHSIESSEIEIREQAFPVLEKVISLFQDRQVDDGRLLDLYDIQFAVAVRSAFELSLSISGAFLSSYLHFATRTDYSPTVLSDYINGLHNCRQRSTAYFFLLTRLCLAGQHRCEDQLKQFLLKQLPIMTKVLKTAMKLQKSDWRTFSAFRALFASCYAELVPAFLWVFSLAQSSPIDVNALLSFFLIEIWRETEYWKFSGAFNAIPVVFEYMHDQIHSELIELVIQTSAKFRDNENFAQILKSCAKLPFLNQNSHEFLMRLGFEDRFDARLFGYLLKNDQARRLRRYSFSIVDRFVREKAQPGLFVLLFDHSPFVIGFALEKILETDFEQKLEIVELALIRFCASDCLPLRRLAKYLIEMLKLGGLQIVAQVLIKNRDVGIALLSGQLAKAVFLLAVSDGTNAKTFLQFVQLILFALRGEQMLVMFAEATFRLAVAVIKKHGRDPQRGPPTVATAVQLMSEVRVLVGGEFQGLWEAVDGKADLCEVLRIQINKAELRKKNANLTSFSTGKRARKGTGDWQTLEIGDSDDQ